MKKNRRRSSTGSQAKRQPTINSAAIRDMSGAGSGAKLLHLTPQAAKDLLERATFINERGRAGGSGPLEFGFDAEGRFDSFTEACAGVGDAETLYGFPFRAESDHLFLYTKAVARESGRHGGYGLLVRGGKLACLTARFEGDRLRVDGITEVAPHALIDFLNACNGSLKDDTVIEQMAWVRAAQGRGLLHPDYPSFSTGFVNGRAWLAVRMGEALPLGFKAYPRLA